MSFYLPSYVSLSAPLPPLPVALFCSVLDQEFRLGLRACWCYIRVYATNQEQLKLLLAWNAEGKEQLLASLRLNLISS